MHLGYRCEKKQPQKHFVEALCFAFEQKSSRLKLRTMPAGGNDCKSYRWRMQCDISEPTKALENMHFRYVSFQAPRVFSGVQMDFYWRSSLKCIVWFEVPQWQMPYAPSHQINSKNQMCGTKEGVPACLCVWLPAWLAQIPGATDSVAIIMCWQLGLLTANITEKHLVSYFISFSGQLDPSASSFAPLLIMMLKFSICRRSYWVTAFCLFVFTHHRERYALSFFRNWILR